MRWNKPAPTHCEVCLKRLRAYFVDGDTVYHAGLRTDVLVRCVMCRRCHAEIGKGFAPDEAVMYRLKTLESVDI